MVAKSYQSLPTKGQPYTKNNKQYILVIKNNQEKEVRWYTENEYNKMYKTSSTIVNLKEIRSKKDTLGFKKNYITLAYYDGENEELEDYLKLSPARETYLWGWYFTSEEELPQDLPTNIKTKKLYWKDITDENENLRKDSDVQDIVKQIKYDNFNSNVKSTFIGKIGERLNLTLTVISVELADNYYGRTGFHTFEDDKGNLYTWKTSARILKENDTYNIRGTIKEHQLVNGKQINVLTRCTVS